MVVPVSNFRVFPPFGVFRCSCCIALHETKEQARDRKEQRKPSLNLAAARLQAAEGSAESRVTEESFAYPHTRLDVNRTFPHARLRRTPWTAQENEKMERKRERS